MPIDKTMQSQMSSDAWRDAKKAVSKPAPKPPPMSQLAKKPDEFEPVSKTDDTPSGLRLAGESGAGAVAGFQIPIGIQKRKGKVDELLQQNPDIGEGIALSYFSGLSEEEQEIVGNMLDTGDNRGIADRMRMYAVRELVRQKVREVVRKKEGGGGYVLYAPNKGKKVKPKTLGTFPTKAGAKRAELARNPPKDPGQLQRLRKYVKNLAKKPGGSDDKQRAKKEGVIPEALPGNVGGGGTPFVPGGTTGTKPVNRDPKQFFTGLKAIPGGLKSQAARDYVKTHLANDEFRTNVQKGPNGAKALGQLYTLAGDPATAQKMQAGDRSAMLKPGQSKVQVGQDIARTEAVREHMERRILSKIVSKSIVEALFREENTESEWDEYISRLSKNAIAGDSKFQRLQKVINSKTSGILDDAFAAIKKAVGKDVHLKSFGTKQDDQSGQTYLAFSAEFEEGNVEPIAIAVEGGLPKIHLSPQAKQALAQVDPDVAKMFRAELVTVQEAILDEMDDLAKATAARDKYLDKLEGNVESYVAGMTPLEISLLKNLLTKKHRKIT